MKSDLSHRFRIGSTYRVIVLALLAVYALSVYVPWQPRFPDSILDSSWALMLHWARLHHIQFGRDLLFTYGPWGFVMTGYHPETYGQMIAAWTLFTAVFFWALVKLSDRLNARWPWSALWIGVVIALSGVTIHLVEDLRLYLLCCALLLVHFYIKRSATSPLKTAMTIVMGLASLSKFSVAFMAIASLGVISIEQILRRRVPWLLAIYVATIVIGWIAAGQSLPNLPPYLRTSLQISSAYADGESEYTTTETLDVCMFLAMSVALLIVLAMAHWRDWRTLLLTQAGFGAMLFLLFKVGYVRHDWHEMVAIHGIGILAILIGCACWPRMPRWPARTIMGVVITAAMGLAWIKDPRWQDHSLLEFVWGTISRLPDRVDAACSWIAGDPKAQHVYRLELSDYQAAHPLPSGVVGSVDSYSWNQGILLAHDQDYRPRPIPQNYLAFSAALSKYNADFLCSARAPDSILFDVEAIDNHLPSQEDAMSWPELLTRYDAMDASQSLLVMHRANPQREFSIVPISEFSSQMNQWIDVPQSDDPIWAQIDIAPTVYGKIVQMLYKRPQILLRTKLANGVARDFRLMRGAAGAGFLLSPVIEDRVDFALLNSATWKNETGDSIVSGIQIAADTESGLSAAFDPAIHVRFFKLQFPHRNLSAVPGIDEHVAFRKFLYGAHAVQTQYGVKMEAGPNGTQVLLAPGNSSFTFPADSKATKMTVNFGVWNSERSDAGPVTATEFRVYTIARDSTNHHPLMRWHRTLDPTRNPQDRGMQAAEINFPDGAPAEVLLESAGDAPPSTHYPYWAGVSFR